MDACTFAAAAAVCANLLLLGWFKPTAGRLLVDGQPAKVELASGVAVSVTEVPEATVSEQSAPHAMPAGSDVTVPVLAAVPDLLTLSVYCAT